ncbi:MAG: helix-turn-helix transcriptional regulator [Halobellus sp.]|uniref:helix-turn-helix transcriptional regulator n=1 Tax=Halobellus sp. TaxID=1979212 RepID=UPI0035D4E971
MRISAPLLALLLVVAATAPAPALALGADPDGGVVEPQVTDGESTLPQTSVTISLRPDRSAYWQVEMQYPLETENETQGFRRIASRYENEQGVVGPRVMLFEALSQQASEATGREMSITNVTYRGSVDADRGTGTLALTFTWINFLEQGDNQTLVLEDVFSLPSAEEDDRQTWLSIFDADQTIRIRPPDGYTVTSTSIAVQQRESAIIFTEPSDFEGDRDLRIVYSTVGPADRLPLSLIGGGAVIAVAIAAGAWVLRGRQTVQPDRRRASGDEVTRPEGPADEPHSSEAAPPAGVSEHSDATPTTDTERDVDDADDESEGIDPSLLSDEERVEHLLEQNGGRMKQATIVDETGWSDAKVSQLLSTMADEGRVNKLRLGRENLISLPDDEQNGTDE